MLGPALLVAPVLRQGATQVEVALSGGGLWYDGVDGTAADAAAQGGAPFNTSAPPDTIRSWLCDGGMLPLRERALHRHGYLFICCGASAPAGPNCNVNAHIAARPLSEARTGVDLSDSARPQDDIALEISSNGAELELGAPYQIVDR